jgi:hypothetical protein
MKKRILQFMLLLCVIILIIYAVRFIKDSDQGTPNQSDKGNRLEKPA